MMKKMLLLAMTALLVVILAACGSGDKQSGESSGDKKNQTITLGVTPWTSTVPPTKVASLILQDMGYKVKETNADVSSIFIGLSRGDIDAYMDSWMPTHENHLEKYGDKVEDLAVSYKDASSGIVVPTYLEDVNSIEDLIGREGEFENEIYGVEPGGNAALKVNETIEAYDLDMKQVNSSEGGMMAQVIRTMEQEKPIAFYGWRPHTMFNKLDIKLLEDPKGVFTSPSIHVIVDSDLKEDAPEVYAFLSNWSIPLEDVEEMIAKIEDGQEAEEVAREWIDNNQDKVDAMLGK